MAGWLADATAASGAIPVTLISFGNDQPHQKETMRALRADDDEWIVEDCRPYLRRDPASVVGHGENGLTPQTQKMVIGQPGFVDLFLRLFDLITGASDGNTYTKIVECCTRGVHRSDTLCRFLENVLNSGGICPVSWLCSRSLRQSESKHTQRTR